jgi:hypothetical protein
MFRYGQAHDGHWTHRHMKIQIEDLIDVLKVVFPSYNFLLLFDQSSGHTKKREDGLNTFNVNREHGGRVPDMRASVLDAECIGERSPSLQAGNTQQLVYPNIEDCTSHEDGPHYCSADERMRRRNDIILPESEDENKTAAELKGELVALGIALAPRQGVRQLRLLAVLNNVQTTKTVDKRVHRDKTIEELKKALVLTGFVFEHRHCRLPELHELSSSRNITTNVTHPRILEGWCGRPKGLLQILCERGKIDPEVPPRSYKKKGTKGTDFEDNGDLKETSKTIHTYLPTFRVSRLCERDLRPLTLCRQTVRGNLCRDN